MPGPAAFAPYGRVPGRPNGSTATAAGFLGILVAVVAGVGVVIALNQADSLRLEDKDSSVVTNLRGLAAVEGVLAFLWFVAGMLLLQCKPAGRIMLIGLSVVGSLGSLISIVVGLALGVPLTAVSGGLILTLGILVVSLCLSPSTTRWLEAGPMPPPFRYTGPVGQPHIYPPPNHMPWGQPPSPPAEPGPPPV
ncbi:hypothetical protein [Nocardia paucivorans]|uniref:hypothetical protein n=1 Tax=Nocardia paucivorans TaxID=114259 RepID=UPI0002FA0B72|nr:hypothetical protein [Nocardia paucivorans]